MSMAVSLKIRVVQMDVLPGLPRANTDTILARISEAKAAGTNLPSPAVMAPPTNAAGTNAGAAPR